MTMLRSCWLVSQGLSLAAVVSGQSSFANMAGYTPGSDVVEHSELDLDMQKLEAAADAFDFATAYEEYSVGGESDKSDGTIRTIQGFSTAAEGKLDAEPYFKIYEAFWGEPAYADTFTSNACLGEGTFAEASNLTRSEGCLKGAQYQNVWMYVIHELEDAVVDCTAGDLTANGGGVNAWDEGWAFYTGSLEGATVGGSDEGQMIYALAQKRCANFGTCDADGVSNVNNELLDLWTRGQTHLEAGECDDAAGLIKEIVPLMTVPLVQGLLRYFYEADPEVVGGAVSDKEASELWAFSAAVLPLIDDCNATVAATVRANTDIQVQTAPMSAGFESLKAELETVYGCLGITCAQVGGYIDEDTGEPFAGFEACEDAASAGNGTFASIAGYTPGSDVVEHSELDLDMAAIEAGADLKTAEGFTAAFTAYSEGENSEKDGGVIRTIQGFSTEADEKLDGEYFFEIWKGYWNDPAYADAFTSSACQGTGEFEGASMLTRSEGCLKGAQYQNVWMYVIHELEDAVNDCRAGDISDNDGGVHAWDEGWAFYAGSLEGTAVGGSDEGQMIYALAEKRCANFGTCDADGDSNVNNELLALWTQGQTHLEEGECDDAAGLIKEKIVPLMAVPLVQGLLRYTYEADPAVMGDVAELDKEASELWAFSAAILPWIHDCDSTVAEVVRANTDIANTATAPMSDGFASVKAQLETVYDCMEITCSQVGGYIDETTNDYFAGFEPCAGSDSDSDSGDSGDRGVSAAGDSDSGDSLDGGGIAGVTIAVAAVAAAVVVGFVLIKRKNARNKAAAVDDNLGNF